VSKLTRIFLWVLAAFLALSFLHVWLNIGFDRLPFSGAAVKKETFRVGFLPVT
jgi:hypothetical protein